MKLLVLFLLTYLSGVNSESCSKLSDLTGTIEDYINANNQERCWLIDVPYHFHITIDLVHLSFESEGHNGLEIIELNTGKKYRLDTKNQIQTLVFPSNVKIIHYARNTITQWWSRFKLSYKIKAGWVPVDGIVESLEGAVSWLKEFHTSSNGMDDSTPRTAIALSLASAVNFNGSNIEEELMKTQLALETAVALLKSPITTNRLSMFVNALLVTCYNPRHFYGKNLVKQLKTQVKETSGFVHPVAYLTLCNSNEALPSKALSDLNSVLSTESDYPFIRDFQAISMLALTCLNNRHNILKEDANTSALYNETISDFKSFQREDGSFGNTHTTALITQVLLANRQETDLSLTSAMEYLIRELNSSSVDFLSVYLILPILNRKTLLDISSTSCLSNPQKYGDDTVWEVNNHSGLKIRVRYSLYIGDEKDVIHTISLRVPNNFTAYEVMEMAQSEDQKYKFEVKIVSEKVYVYKIANITNDPEAGKFWLQYFSSSNNTSNLTHFSTNLDELTMNNEQHLVMWYKTATI